ncbi:tRNA (adenosine(37)-N6)-threonylcarbamoyltransferase complex dimerization subunit type 1 TsaB [Nocardia cyriacigeorgica]|uniref:tRNA (adenosine(37)-N6)-threonylcarbamoyltransferase complex dimerization subunit type 1 TsaB n=1 Tax=Nocardia cyriacigeorgica TaxID=135487 RepID=UPI001894AA07|nr:tRNA (adenosine(37)-N6)-threonylcarbamoyltransferase complex dimerization subunit type 1 TsaB [Nocardia cyriacigeorgica]MBF6161238.1 tRNA (adenosine(37)-N6)-threonylcarbamoyltransferase complex dimerization subunit type 1 TsaB [Nocardia cyriacigeorgica]MBF6200037.1 tRNA (adenosine(37)-N6)-threonylcarbamoyltransferase complex dimerization subunit type 1 TsaB [Nocardia cyriacigeorgica]MBF6319798.1 tRNA (adenosine(37)-N6)-threonylcarbamoyltransferase complex dimerization subunit type 1 TsaB [Noc
MLVLAVDTATPAVTAGLVELEQSAAGAEAPVDVRTIAVRVRVDARAHAEVLTPQILECLTEAGRSRTDIAAVVVGVGPGPFTGLRVGMATAAAFGDALGIPVYGVCSLDAIAADGARDLAPGAELLVVTDARRREVYSARYREDVPWALGGIGRRVAGPEVGKPAELDTEKATVIAGSASHVDLFDLPVLPVETPSPAGLVRVAAPQVLARAVPEPLVPLYLRRPDAVEQSYRTLDRTGA